MLFLNSGVDIDTFMASIDLKDLALESAKKVVKDNTIDAVTNTVKDTANLVKDKVIGFITGRPSAPAEYYYTNLKCGNIKASIAIGISDYLSSNSKFKELTKNYDGGSSIAISDISSIVRRVLDTKDYSIDQLLTFAYNLNNLIQNHSMIQVLGFLRADDWWYNDTAMSALSCISGL